MFEELFSFWLGFQYDLNSQYLSLGHGGREIIFFKYLWFESYSSNSTTGYNGKFLLTLLFYQCFSPGKKMRRLTQNSTAKQVQQPSRYNSQVGTTAKQIQQPSRYNSQVDTTAKQVTTPCTLDIGSHLQKKAF